MTCHFVQSALTKEFWEAYHSTVTYLIFKDNCPILQNIDATINIYRQKPEEAATSSSFSSEVHCFLFDNQQRDLTFTDYQIHIFQVAYVVLKV